MADYVVKNDSWIDGKFRKSGDTVTMTEIAAEHLLASGQIEPAKAPPAVAPKSVKTDKAAS